MGILRIHLVVIPEENPDANFSIRISNTMLRFPAGMTSIVVNFGRSIFITLLSGRTVE